MSSMPDRLGANASVPTTTTAPRKSLDIKQELNSAMRNALREAAGDPLAELRWTKPEQLEGYGVRIIDWPPEIALRSPSNNPVRDNKTLLSLLKSGQLRFVRKDSSEWEQADPGALVRSTAQAQALAQAPAEPQHIPPAQLVSTQPPAITRNTSAGFIHPHPHQHAPGHNPQPPPLQHQPGGALATQPPPPPPQQQPQQPPQPGQPQGIPPHQQPLPHPQIAYVYQVPPPGHQAWIPIIYLEYMVPPMQPHLTWSSRTRMRMVREPIRMEGRLLQTRFRRRVRVRLRVAPELETPRFHHLRQRGESEGVMLQGMSPTMRRSGIGLVRRLKRRQVDTPRGS